jgi:hypothetical protein
MAGAAPGGQDRTSFFNGPGRNGGPRRNRNGNGGGRRNNPPNAGG